MRRGFIEMLDGEPCDRCGRKPIRYLYQWHDLVNRTDRVFQQVCEECFEKDQRISALVDEEFYH